MLLLIFLYTLLLPKFSSLTDEKAVLLDFKSLLEDSTNNLASWTVSNPRCQFSGVTCDPKTGNVTGILLENMSLGGTLSPSLCRLTGLKKLVLTSTSITGQIPIQLLHCRHLKVLNLTSNNLDGRIPDLSGLRKLEALDLSWNNFIGELPTWVGKLTRLVSLGLGSIMFDKGTIPESIGNLKKLTWLFLSNCTRVGDIPESIYRLRELDTLDLSINMLSGTLSKSIAELRKVSKIELFSNNLTGEILAGLANLNYLQEFDISRNHFYGNLPPEIGNLKNLTVFQLYENQFTGELPSGFGDLRHLKAFSIYRNSFSGKFPANLGRLSPLNSIDISENNFTGPFPSYLCESRKLEFLLALSNQFSGVFPASYADCKSLIRFRISQNRLSGKIPDGIWTMPKVEFIDLESNDFTGEISPNIAFSNQLSELFLANNRFTGVIPPEIGTLTNLNRLCLGNNSFSGVIPPQIGSLTLLEVLQMNDNHLNGSIPPELCQCMKLDTINLAGNLLEGVIPGTFSQLNMLNSLNLSGNRFVGSIPASLGSLHTIDLSDNQLSGSIPPELLVDWGEKPFLGNRNLCVAEYMKALGKFVIPQCSGEKADNRGMSFKTLMTSVILSVLIVILLAVLFLKQFKFLRCFNYDDDIEAKNALPSKWIVKSFHRLEFNVDEVSNLEERNLIGSGSTGKVYRLKLKKNGETVAVKRLSKGAGLEAFSSEMDIMQNIRHRNILKLYACLLRDNIGFLLFEYMPKGNLCEVLQREPELDWRMRYKIGFGVAKALSYLHHDCSPPIIHRDVKSANILLCEDYEPKLADFGLARVSELSPEGSVFSSFAGTHGYIAPELAYTRKVTEKSDVYSFGMVLFELLTGKRPGEEPYAQGMDLVHWIRSNLNDEQSAIHILDQKMESDYNKDDIMNVIKIANLCTNNIPSLRPTMRDVVKMLSDANPRAVKSLADLTGTS